jgi:hypothetical protein
MSFRKTHHRVTPDTRLPLVTTAIFRDSDCLFSSDIFASPLFGCWSGMISGPGRPGIAPRERYVDFRCATSRHVLFNPPSGFLREQDAQLSTHGFVEQTVSW